MIKESIAPRDGVTAKLSVVLAFYKEVGEFYWFLVFSHEAVSKLSSSQGYRSV